MPRNPLCLMDFTLTQYAIITLGGLVAGAMNALAGYGSIITLSVLMDVVGLPGTIANGTNRVNVVTNTIGGILGFSKNGKLDYKTGKWIIIITTVSAIFGIWTAIHVSNEQFKFIFRYLVILLFFVILINPKKWLRVESEIKDLAWWKLILIFFPIGFYGGFIQMGMGLFFIAASVLIAGYNIISANAIKLVTVLLFNLIGIVIFHINGLIDWKIGIILGVSTFIGGYFTADLASRYKNANVWAYRMLIFIVILVILKTFGVISL